MAAATFIALVVGLAGFALSYLSPSLFHAHKNSPPTFEQTELSRDRLLKMNDYVSQAELAPGRDVYPYSVIPGGVEDAKELKWVAEHDPVVAMHYAGFDYDHAKIVRLTLAQTVYLSYRIGNHIYWTSHRVTLHKGEKVLTDGRITARIRCANRVEKVPQQAAAPVEPPAVVFDQPVRMPTGTAMQSPPVPFQSALLNRSSAIGSMGPLSLYDPIDQGGLIGFSPPPLPTALCGPNRKKGSGDSGCCPGEEGIGKKKKPGCGGGIGVVPEPGTWIMLASGLVGILWLARRKSKPGYLEAAS
jgi:hypothetical protein